MRRPLAYSVLLHVVVIAVVAFGLPALSPAPLVVEEPIVVDLVSVAERANPPPTAQAAPEPEIAPPAPPRPTREAVPRPAEPRVVARPARPALPKPEPPKPEPKAEPQPEKPEPKPQVSKPQPPKPDVARTEPKPEPPKPEPRAVRTEPESEVKPQAKPSSRDVTPESKPEPKPTKTQTSPEAKQAPPEQKPEPPKAASQPAAVPPKPEPSDDFASVMKAVDDLKQSGKSTGKSSPSTKGRAENSGEADLGAQVTQALRSVGPPGNKSSLPVTASEIDAVRRQIERCWNLPAGAKDAGDLVVSIKVEMNPDGTPRTATVDGSSRGQGNPVFQATADSARRAVLNPRCHPFKLPPDKYDRWRTMTLIFNPRQMS
jgi:hypothetical protein